MTITVSLDPKLATVFTIDDMSFIDMDDIRIARSVYEPLPTALESIVAQVVQDVLHENGVGRCEFNCPHTDSEECPYQNWKEAMTFYIMACVDGENSLRNRLYAFPILNARVEREKAHGHKTS